MVWIPTVDYILTVFKDQIESPHLMNREGLISTLDKVEWGNPSQGIPTIWEQVTILYKEIIENHYFMDGNKRIGVLITYIFLFKNGFNFTPPQGEIYSFTMNVAQGNTNFSEIKDWFQKNSLKLE